MTRELRDCRTCAHAYLTDEWAWLTTECLRATSVYCAVPREGERPHVGSYRGTVDRPIPERCDRYEEREGEPKVWPEPTPEMRKAGLFWTDVEPAPPSEQTTLEAFVGT